MKEIAIIGSTASGKTALSLEIGKNEVDNDEAPVRSSSGFNLLRLKF